MSVFATGETTYLDNTVSFCSSVKSGRIVMMSSIKYVKTEISTQNTWYLPPYHLKDELTLRLMNQTYWHWLTTPGMCIAWYGSRFSANRGDVDRNFMPLSKILCYLMPPSLEFHVVHTIVEFLIPSSEMLWDSEIQQHHQQQWWKVVWPVKFNFHQCCWWCCCW